MASILLAAPVAWRLSVPRFPPYGDDDDDSYAKIAGVDLSANATKFMIQPGAGINFVAGDGWGVVAAADYRRVFLDEDEDGESGENEFRIFVGIRLMLD